MKLSWEDVYNRAAGVAWALKEIGTGEGELRVYGVPNGGILAAQAVVSYLQAMRKPILVDLPEEADVIVDDLLDSGSTKDSFTGYHLPFFVLVDKQVEKINEWVTFPWETMRSETGPEDAVRRLLQYLGEDVNRDGLRKTPERVIKSYDKLFGGYKQDPAKVMTVFEEPCDEMVLIRDVEFSSCCEHHMLPFFGKAHMAYIPNGRVLGISKLVRVLEIYARRLQIQERLCQQVTQALDQYLEPQGSACVLEAQHLCMVCRGVEKQHSVMVTSSLTGVFKTNPAARNEFMGLIGR